MNLTCPKCQKLIQISDDKLPHDKEKAMIKCPFCQQVIVFNVPKNAGQTHVSPPKEEKTIVENVSTGKKNGCFAKLIEVATAKEYRLQIGENIIGRKADIAIDNGDKYISRKHCVVMVVEKTNGIEVILTDNGSISETGEPSTNGTFHKQKRLTKHDKVYLDNNDKIKIGHTDFKLVIG